MGKKRIITKKGSGANSDKKSRAISRTTRRKVASGVLHVQSHHNNTRLTLTDTQGQTLAWSSSGTLGLTGSKKATPFAAAQVGEVMAEKAEMIGVKEVDVIVKGAGSGREAAIRSFIGGGVKINRIQDTTPVPHGGVRPRKSRRQ